MTITKMSDVERFLKAWENYKANRGKTRTMAGIYTMAILAEKESKGIAHDFFDAWEKRHGQG